uniref:Uncharacterized protein n=1 Tax=Cacopsylla melanoneura TaxID=428564 RepID=A0A8D8WG76_9HEMI
MNINNSVLLDLCPYYYLCFASHTFGYILNNVYILSLTHTQIYTVGVISVSTHNMCPQIRYSPDISITFVIRIHTQNLEYNQHFVQIQCHSKVFKKQFRIPNLN